MITLKDIKKDDIVKIIKVLGNAAQRSSKKIVARLFIENNNRARDIIKVYDELQKQPKEFEVFTDKQIEIFKTSFPKIENAKSLIVGETKEGIVVFDIAIDDYEKFQELVRESSKEELEAVKDYKDKLSEFLEEVVESLELYTVKWEDVPDDTFPGGDLSFLVEKEIVVM